MVERLIAIRMSGVQFSPSRHGFLVQMVEQGILNPYVMGSIPIEPSIFGQVAERSKARGCKPRDLRVYEGSNPSLPTI